MLVGSSFCILVILTYFVLLRLHIVEDMFNFLDICYISSSLILSQAYEIRSAMPNLHTY